jgi:predicted transposase/invertase (TIGR01784 family)
MKPHIDPKVDCVFKAMLGKEDNTALLIHFLNAVLHRNAGDLLQEVVILNPYNERDFASDKLSVVDIKARDEQGRSYQIEIQLALHPGFSSRILYTWSTIYHGLLRKGEQFTALRPVIAIWLLNESLFAGLSAYHLPFVVYNREHEIVFSDHLQLHVLQLPDWQFEVRPYEELDRWMYLFKEGPGIDVDDPPVILQTPEMRQAMHVLQHFAENEAEYLLYQKRLDVLRVEASWKMELEQLHRELEQERREKDQAKRREEQARREKDQAKLREEQERQEKERLLELLKHAGIDPNQENLEI